MDWEWEWDSDVGIEAGAEIWLYPYRDGSEEGGGSVDMGSVEGGNRVSITAVEAGDNPKKMMQAEIEVNPRKTRNSPHGNRASSSCASKSRVLAPPSAPLVGSITTNQPAAHIVCLPLLATKAVISAFPPCPHLHHPQIRSISSRPLRRWDSASPTWKETNSLQALE
jgi:hypothetical protein